MNVRQTNRWISVVSHLVTVVIVGALVLAQVELDQKETVRKDALNYVTLGYNLARHGVFSSACRDFQNTCSDADLVPSFYREPFFPAVLALGISLNPRFATLERSQFMPSPDTMDAGIHRTLRGFQWGQLVLTAAVAGAAAYVGLGSSLAAYLTFYLVGTSPALTKSTTVFLTEITSALLFAVVVLCATLSVKSGRAILYAACGAAIAALALTKAVFFYVWPALFLGFCLSWWRYRLPLRKCFENTLFFVLPIVLIVGTWMLRNFVTAGAFVVADRGGAHLHLRLSYNTMTRDEYLASFLIWSPGVFTKELLHERFPPNIRDRFVDTNPDGFRESAKKLYVEAWERYGHVEGDAVLKKEALAAILSNPLKHVAVSFAMMYRMFHAEYGRNFFGSWKISGGEWNRMLMTGFVLSVPLVLSFGMHALIPAYSLALGAFFFFGLFSNCIPRYMQTFLPMLYLGNVAVAISLVEKGFSLIVNRFARCRRFSDQHVSKPTCTTL